MAPSFARSYDPIGPIRSPLSRTDPKKCAADMASVMALFAASNDGTCTVDDLQRAGFSQGEIERHRGEAARLTSERLRPRQVDTKQADTKQVDAKRAHAA